jgi:nicotinamidase-related amidase
MPIDVLLIIDVQNCFISGGSLGGDNLNDSIEQMKEIEELIDKNNFIIFTRDYHPLLHFSTPMFPYHCRNKNRKCKRNTDNLPTEGRSSPSFLIPKELENRRVPENIEINKSITIDDYKKKINNSFIDNIDNKYDDNEILGTNLSYLYYGTKYANIVDTLIKDDNKQFTIGLDNKFKDSHNLNPNLSYIDYSKDILTDKNNFPDKKFNQLTKGEYCKYDSFSAFNYHVKFNENKSDIQNVPLNKKYSTGLMEYLIEWFGDVNATLNITVCGLVGNICVMHTILQGCALWNKIYKKNTNLKINFIYQLKGTRFLLGEQFGDFKLKYNESNLEIEKLNNYFIKNLTSNNNISFSVNYDDTEIFTFPVNNQVGGSNKYVKYKTKYLKLKNY